MKFPYNVGWPINPFTRLSPKEMAKLLKAIQEQHRKDVGEALL